MIAVRWVPVRKEDGSIVVRKVAMSRDEKGVWQSGEETGEEQPASIFEKALIVSAEKEEARSRLAETDLGRDILKMLGDR